MSTLISKYKILIVSVATTLVVAFGVWGCNQNKQTNTVVAEKEYTTPQDREMCKTQPNLSSCEDFK